MTATKKNIPGKRLKTWHRRFKRETKTSMSLLECARTILAGDDVKRRETVLKWAGGKAAP